MRLQEVDIATYRSSITQKAGSQGFKAAVVEDLERRRDRYCPVAKPIWTVAVKDKTIRNVSSLSKSVPSAESHRLPIS
jgi:hypothetical protein